MTYQNNPISESDYITGNKFIRICDKYNIVFSKTDNVWEGLNELKLRTDNPRIFVTHQSDYSITEEHVKHLPKDVVWFAENCEVIDNPNVIGIPNGLNNVDFVISKASKHGKYSSCFAHITDFHGNLSKQHFKPKAVENLVYMNFTPDTFSSERTSVYTIFKDKPFVTKKNNISHLDFARDVYNHPFVLSPRGNGYDCVRTWESIYLGSIPIIKKNNVMLHFSDLPILLVEDWEEITENLLLSTLDNFRNKQFDMSKAKISYWEKVFAKYVTITSTRSI